MSETQSAAAQLRPMSAGRKSAIVGIWIFPYLLAGLAYGLAVFFEPAAALRAPVLVWPVPEAVYGWLLLLVLLAGGWLFAELISVTNRETVVLALQLDAVLSTTTAVLFTGLAGWFLGKGTLEWWFVVPWGATIFDALAAGWLAINNAAQKPFLSQRGTI
ncbi:MAG TPA: hypothetical protein VNK52_15350 [Hyphomicrobiaceae bacterium]|nr:hypothetical protein [Hyphomicrobiaceae bacterium]